MEELNNWDYAIENNRKKKRKEAQEFLDKVGYDFDENELNLRDSLAYDFVKEEVDELVREHDKAMNTIRQLNTPYNDVRDMHGSYKSAENVGHQRNDVSRGVSSPDDDTFLHNIGKHIIKHEGVAENPYLDTKGNITIGNGQAIKTREQFLALNLTKGKRLATKQEKSDTYDIFVEMQKKREYGQSYKANYYEDKSDLQLSKDSGNKLMMKHLRNDLIKVRKDIPNFDTLPFPLKIVLLDITYNTGNVNQDNWPKLHRAIKDKNLSLVLKNVHRQDIQKERNQWAEDLIKSIDAKDGWHW